MKEIGFYKTEVLKRIDAERETLGAKRRSRLSFAYPLTLFLTFLILFFPGMPGNPRNESHAENAHYSDHQNEFNGSIEFHPDFTRPVRPSSNGTLPDLGDVADSASHGYGEAGAIFDAAPSPDALIVKNPDALIVKNHDDSVIRSAAVARNGISMIRWSTGDGAYFLFTPLGAEQKKRLAPFFPLLSVMKTDGKPIARRLTEEILADIENTVE